METIALALVVAIISVLATKAVISRKVKTYSVNVKSTNEDQADRLFVEKTGYGIPIQMFRKIKHPTSFEFQLKYFKQ